MLILPRLNYNYNGKPKVLFEVGLARSQIDTLRGRTILQNFILIKILIAHILLSPWNFGVSKKPTNNIKRIVNNHRVLATVIYEILRLVDPEVPGIEQVAFSAVLEDKEKAFDQDDEKILQEVENNDGVEPLSDASKVNKKSESEEDSRLEKFLGVILGRTKKSNSEVASNSIEERLWVQEMLLAAYKIFIIIYCQQNHLTM